MLGRAYGSGERGAVEPHGDETEDDDGADALQRGKGEGDHGREARARTAGAVHCGWCWGGWWLGRDAGSEELKVSSDVCWLLRRCCRWEG